MKPRSPAGPSTKPFYDTAYGAIAKELEALGNLTPSHLKNPSGAVKFLFSLPDEPENRPESKPDTLAAARERFYGKELVNKENVSSDANTQGSGNATSSSRGTTTSTTTEEVSSSDLRRAEGQENSDTTISFGANDGSSSSQLDTSAYAGSSTLQSDTSSCNSSSFSSEVVDSRKSRRKGKYAIRSKRRHTRFSQVVDQKKSSRNRSVPGEMRRRKSSSTDSSVRRVVGAAVKQFHKSSTHFETITPLMRNTEDRNIMTVLTMAEIDEAFHRLSNFGAKQHLPPSDADEMKALISAQSKHLDNLLIMIQKAEAGKQKADELAATAQKDYERLSNFVVTNKAEFERVRSERDQLREQLSKFDDERAGMNRELEALRESRASTENELKLALEKRNAELDRLLSDNRSLASDVADLIDCCQAYRAEIEGLRGLQEELRTEFEHLLEHVSKSRPKHATKPLRVFEWEGGKPRYISRGCQVGVPWGSLSHNKFNDSLAEIEMATAKIEQQNKEIQILKEFVSLSRIQKKGAKHGMIESKVRIQKLEDRVKELEFLLKCEVELHQRERVRRGVPSMMPSCDASMSTPFLRREELPKEIPEIESEQSAHNLWHSLVRRNNQANDRMQAEMQRLDELAGKWRQNERKKGAETELELESAVIPHVESEGQVKSDEEDILVIGPMIHKEETDSELIEELVKKNEEVWQEGSLETLPSTAATLNTLPESLENLLPASDFVMPSPQFLTHRISDGSSGKIFSRRAVQRKPRKGRSAPPRESTWSYGYGKSEDRSLLRGDDTPHFGSNLSSREPTRS